MEAKFLENAKSKFLYPREDIYYEGRDVDGVSLLMKMLGIVIPNRVTAEELFVYLKFLIMDLKDGVCRFHNSQEFKRTFEQYAPYIDNIEMWLTYLPNYLMVIVEPEFYNEFLQLFKESFYHLHEEDQDKDYGCVEVGEEMIDISMKDKAEVLMQLYNHAKPVGMGIVQYDPTPMTIELARYALENIGYQFGYLKGRVMKINLKDDVIYVGGYNRDNDQEGLAQKAISKCRNKLKSGEEKKLIFHS